MRTYSAGRKTSKNTSRLASMAALLTISLAANAEAHAGAESVQYYDGTLVVEVIDDFENGRATTSYYLRHPNLKDLVQLRLTGQQAEKLLPGQRLRVRGRLLEGALVPDSSNGAVAAVGGTAANALPNAARRLITLIVDITDSSGNVHAVSDRCDGAEQLTVDNSFGTVTGQLNVDGCYQDGSFGALGFGGGNYPGSAVDVVRVAIAEPATSLAGICAYPRWADAADSVATGLGINLNAYQHRVYVLPQDASCNWSGVAYLGCGDACRAWVKAYASQPCGYPGTIAHELGHNLDLMHAGEDLNNDGVSDCEYCDYSDVMGYGTAGLRTFNAPHKDMMGWLSPSRLVDGTAGGTFRISALELANPESLQSVKIASPSGVQYWLGFRGAFGYDALFPQNSLFVGKTQVHRADQSRNTSLIALISDGEEHQVEPAGLTVTQLSHSADSALVHARVGDQCTNQPVPVSFTPSERATNRLPATRRFSLTLENTDNPQCAPSTWPLEFRVPPDWSARLTNANVSLAPGASETVTLIVDIPLGTPHGSYEVQMAMSEHSGRPAVGFTGTVLVDLAPPMIAISSPASGASYAQNLTVSSSYTCSDAESYVTDCVGPVTSGDSFDTKTLGTKSFVVKATDRAGNVVSKTVSYTVVARNPEFSLVPASLSFGSQTVGLTSTPKSVTFTNTGNVPISIASISLSGTHAAQFSYQTNCASPVSIAATCSMSVLFTPAGAGSKTAKLEVTVGSTKKTVALSGTGAGAASSFTVTPANLAFGNVTVGKTSAAKLVTISNTGSTGFDIKSLTFTGTHKTQFRKASACPAILPAASSCTVSITFRPAAKGAKSAALKVTPVSGAAKTVALTGTGK